MVEQVTVNDKVGGSKPPPGVTWLILLTVRITGFHPVGRSSILLSATWGLRLKVRHPTENRSILVRLQEPPPKRDRSVTCQLDVD